MNFTFRNTGRALSTMSWNFVPGFNESTGVFAIPSHEVPSVSFGEPALSSAFVNIPVVNGVLLLSVTLNTMVFVPSEIG